MHRGRWFLLGIGVGVVGTRRVATALRPILERPLEQSAKRSVKRMRGDVKVALREAIAAYRNDVPPGRVVEGHAREINGFQ
jgi:phosphate uptake regulator